MRKLLLFMVTIMLFFLFLVPIIFPFRSDFMGPQAVGAAYTFWYIMMFILALTWGDVVYRKGCWFFER